MPSLPDQHLLLKLYKQLADTMQTLIEIEQLENEIEASQTNLITKNDESQAVNVVKPKKPRLKNKANIFDDEEDIKRFDQVCHLLLYSCSKNTVSSIVMIESRNSK